MTDTPKRSSSRSRPQRPLSQPKHRDQSGGESNVETPDNVEPLTVIQTLDQSPGSSRRNSRVAKEMPGSAKQGSERSQRGSSKRGKKRRSTDCLENMVCFSMAIHCKSKECLYNKKTFLICEKKSIIISSVYMFMLNLLVLTASPNRLDNTMFNINMYMNYFSQTHCVHTYSVSFTEPVSFRLHLQISFKHLFKSVGKKGLVGRAQFFSKFPFVLGEKTLFSVIIGCVEFPCRDLV